MGGFTAGEGMDLPCFWVVVTGAEAVSLLAFVDLWPVKLLTTSLDTRKSVVVIPARLAVLAAGVDLGRGLLLLAGGIRHRDVLSQLITHGYIPPLFLCRFG